MLSHKELLHICTYDPETGHFTWRNPPFHKNNCGKRMGRVTVKGYIRVVINNVSYSASRLAWFYMTRGWPKAQIDHKNRIAGDNRWSNLREATAAQNRANSVPGKTRRNKSGYRGVIKSSSNRWRASINKEGKTVCVGDFSNKEAAAIAYDLEAHKQHGEFAVLNFPTSPQRDWILL